MFYSSITIINNFGLLEDDELMLLLSYNGTEHHKKVGLSNHYDDYVLDRLKALKLKKQLDKEPLSAVEQLYEV